MNQHVNHRTRQQAACGEQHVEPWKGEGSSYGWEDMCTHTHLQISLTEGSCQHNDSTNDQEQAEDEDDNSLSVHRTLCDYQVSK